MDTVENLNILVDALVRSKTASYTCDGVRKSDEYKEKETRLLMNMMIQRDKLLHPDD